MVKIAPSILSADFANLASEIHEVEQAGADMVHVDVMDGHFVPNITLGPPVVRSVRAVTSLPLDVHLMIEHAEDYIDAFVEAGADMISVHAEACTHLHRVIQQIKNHQKKAGVVLNPATSLSVLDHILEDLDYVLIMTVNPGFGGQSFISSTLPKIRKLRSRIEQDGLDIEIEVDGGIQAKTAKCVYEAGAGILVAGNAIFGQSDRKEAIERLRNSIGQ